MKAEAAGADTRRRNGKKRRPARRRLPQEVLKALCCRLRKDGGMSKPNLSQQGLHSAVTVLALIQQGYHGRCGLFSVRFRRLMRFLKWATTQPQLNAGERVLLTRTLERVENSSSTIEDWTTFASLHILNGQGSARAGWLMFAAMLANEEQLKDEGISTCQVPPK